jgi:hypothetical protein
MQREQIAEQLLSSTPVRVLARTASRAGRQLNRSGRLLNRRFQTQPLAAVATLLASNLATVLLTRARQVAPRPAFAARAAAIGAVAAGALALGVVSIGALAIARVAIRSMRIKRLHIDVLEVRQNLVAPLAAGGAPA